MLCLNIIYPFIEVCTFNLGRKNSSVWFVASVIGIRDVDSVELLQKRLQSASHVAVLGNGGIANEFVCEVESCDVTWIVKDNYLNSAFLDPGHQEKGIHLLLSLSVIHCSFLVTLICFSVLIDSY